MIKGKFLGADVTVDYDKVTCDVKTIKEYLELKIKFMQHYDGVVGHEIEGVIYEMFGGDANKENIEWEKPISIPGNWE